jgi:hypothetical protein
MLLNLVIIAHRLVLFRKEVTFLPLKVGETPGVPDKGKRYIIAGILRVAIGDARTQV